jgi:hypothetical protein
MTMTMTKFQRPTVLPMLLLIGSLLMLSCSDAFAPIARLAQHERRVDSMSSSQLFFEPSSTIGVSAGTVDPTTFLSDVFNGILGTPIILAVPILAALGVSGLIAWLIVSYASPVVEDDEQ